MSDSASPGWYHAEGDPPNTERYWDGSAWTEGPRPIAGAFGSDMPITGGDTSGGADASTSPLGSQPGSDMPITGAPSPGSDFGTVTPGAGTPAPGTGFPPVTPPNAGGGFPGAPQPAGFPGAAPTGYYSEASQATLALVLSIVGLLCCVTAPFGAYFGYAEKKGIDEGRRDPSNRGQAVAALVIGGLVTALGVLGLLLIMIGAAAGG